MYSAVTPLIFLTGFLIASPASLAQNKSTPNTETFDNLHDSASNGSAEAQFELGIMFEYGKGVAQDDAMAARWYEKAAAQQFTEAQYRLAVLYDNGWGMKTDKKKAFRLFEAAAKSGHELAQHDLAMMYFGGTGTPKNLVQAYKWLQIAVLNGSSLMQKHINRISAQMTSDEIDYANYLAHNWQDQGI
jgi:TPR repeat protein